MALELVIFTGLQGSGKSSFYRARFTGTHEHVSKDLFPNARRPEARQRRLIQEALAAGRSVVVDNTNPGPEQRIPLIEIGRAFGATIIGYVFEADIKECLERNATRTGRARVPEVGIFATAKRLQPPSPDEGFDQLYRVHLSGQTFDVKPFT